jgi:hypothetical protein
LPLLLRLLLLAFGLLQLLLPAACLPLVLHLSLLQRQQQQQQEHKVWLLLLPHHSAHL